MINFNHLRIFYHAAMHQNFSQAAKALFITQPAVSAQIRRLESQCNLIFFKKRGRRVYLTDEGKALYRYANKIFHYERDIEIAIEEMCDLKRGILRLGTTKTYAHYFMPFMVSNFLKKFPNIKIHLDEGSSRDMIYSLLDFKNEVAIIATAEEHPDVKFVPFSQEEIKVILPPGHPLSEKPSVGIKEIANEPIIMKEVGSGTRKRVSELFAESRCQPEILMETSNTPFIKELVQRGEGISFLVKAAVVEELRAKKLATVPIKNHRILLDVSVAYLKDQHLSPPALAFVTILDTMTQKDLTPQGIGSLMAKMLAARKKKLQSTSNAHKNG